MKEEDDALIAEPAIERWSFSLDPESAALVERDLGRALVLQNARAASRFDALRNHRSPQAEARRRTVMLGLCALGASLAVILVVGHYVSTREVSIFYVGLLVLFLLLFPVFWFLPRLRQAWMSKIDRLLWRRAAGAIQQSLSDMADRGYEIEGAEVRRVADGTPTVSHSLGDLPYALVGEASILLFKTGTTQNPGMILLVAPSERERVVEVLEKAGASTEPLARRLLPPLNLLRRW